MEKFEVESLFMEKHWIDLRFMENESCFSEKQQDIDENLLAVKHSNRPVVNYQGSKVMNLCLSGVYLLFCDKEIVYIGESKNPNQRIGNHVKDKVFDGYRILPTNRRKYWEKILIKRYEPKYNSNWLNKVIPIPEWKNARLWNKVRRGNCKFWGS